MGYVFKSGKFAGMSIEQVYLTRYVELKNLINWFKQNRKNDYIVGEFYKLERAMGFSGLERQRLFYYAEDYFTKREQRKFCKKQYRALGIKRVTKKAAKEFFDRYR